MFQFYSLRLFASEFMDYFRYLPIVFLMVVLSCRNDPAQHGDVNRAYAEYMVGISMLQGNRSIPRFDQQAMRIEQLRHVTGVENDSMIACLSSLKDHPEKGFEFYSIMKQLEIPKKDSVSHSKK